MPKYIFECEDCQNIIEKHITISEFLEYKKTEKTCPKCKCHNILQQVAVVGSRVDEHSHFTAEKAKDFARKIVKKIDAGDERAIREYCGDDVNTLKFKNS